MQFLMMLPKKSHLRRRKKNVLKVFARLRAMRLWSIIVTVAIPIIATGYINLVTIGDRYRSSAQIPHEDVAIVFGAGLSANMGLGVPSADKPAPNTIATSSWGT